MLYVEKDLSAIVKAVLDHWDSQKPELNGKYLQASGGRVSPKDIVATVQKGTWPLYPCLSVNRAMLILSWSVSGKNCEYVVLPTTGVPERDVMFELYNEVGMHPGVQFPDPKVLNLGVKFHNVEEYVREKLLPHLGLKAVD